MRELPTGWDTFPFEDVADVQLGKMLDKVKNKGHPTRYLRNVNVRWGAFDLSDLLEMRMSDSERQLFDIRDGDLLVCEGGEPGRCAVWDRGSTALTFQKALMRVRSKGCVEPRYLANYLRYAAFSGDLDQNFTGSTIKHLPKNALCRSKIPLPPLAEQRRIVPKLNALSTRTTRSRHHLDLIPSLCVLYKQAVFKVVFGESASHQWETRSIGEIADVGTGATPKRGETRYYQDGKIPWITSSAVNRARVKTADQFITQTALRETNCKIFAPGTLLIAMYGEGQTRGRVAILDIEAATNQALAAVSVKPDSPIRTSFLYWFLQSNYLELRSAAAGGVQPNLSLGIIKAMPVPLPPLSEQDNIVHRIEHAFAKVDRLAVDAASARRLLDRLDQAVLAKAFRGELVSQNPSDEPASVMVERIRADRAAAPSSRRSSKTAA